MCVVVFFRPITETLAKALVGGHLICVLINLHYIQCIC